MIYPGTGSYGLGQDGGQGQGQGGAPDSLEERKRQLIQKLMVGSRNQTGLNGTHAMPLFGGRGRSGGDNPQGALPQISYNPYLAMAAGRPNEQFSLPNGLTQAALAQAQRGFDPIMGGGAQSDPSYGLAPQNIGDPGQQAAQTFVGAGMGGGGGVAGSPGAVGGSGGTAGMDPSYQAQGGTRHLVGDAGNFQQVPNWFLPRVGANIAR